jgi:hypothetical protein
MNFQYDSQNVMRAELRLRDRLNAEWSRPTPRCWARSRSEP